MGRLSTSHLVDRSYLDDDDGDEQYPEAQNGQDQGDGDHECAHGESHEKQPSTKDDWDRHNNAHCHDRVEDRIWWVGWVDLARRIS